MFISYRIYRIDNLRGQIICFLNHKSIVCGEKVREVKVSGVSPEYYVISWSFYKKTYLNFPPEVHKHSKHANEKLGAILVPWRFFWGKSKVIREKACLLSFCGCSNGVYRCEAVLICFLTSAWVFDPYCVVLLGF